MKEFQGVLALQVDSIIDQLRRLEQARSGRLIRQAETEAEELRRASRRKLLVRAREAVREERRRREKALQMAEHRIRAEAGLRMQAHYADLLREGWPLLVDELERRWANPQARETWCSRLIDTGLRAFGRTAWTIEHPADWTEADTRRLCRSLDANGVPEPSFRLDDSLAAGLRIRCDTACIDGSIDGLLADRPRVEGRLLAAWEGLDAQKKRGGDG